jgi:hypothetical protein
MPIGEDPLRSSAIAGCFADVTIDVAASLRVGLDFRVHDRRA